MILKKKGLQYCPPLLIMLGFSVFNGCGEEKEKAGEAISPVIAKVGTNAVPAKIGDIIANPDDYAGKLVKLEGRISWECPDGCELHLQDDTGVIFVALYPSGIAIPQKLGSTAIVEGKVTEGRDKLTIIGKRIEIR